MNTRQTVLFLLFATSAVAANFYVLFFAFRPWRTMMATRALMLLSAGDVALLNLGAASIILGNDRFPAARWLLVLAMFLFLLGRVYLLVALLRAPGNHNYPPRSWWHKESS